ncbi:nodulin-related protein 2 [Humulus lupulus]|uniref:nodulin-related protein 2 n=1 Tax=Humulus lupulus TaxID=3486 RepID=UPI002B409865|nr:nodulin-related protein 2 [Humulus lupulus]
MDHLLSSMNKPSGGPGKDHSGDHHQKQHPSSNELFSSAKQVGEAAHTAASQGFDRVDKGKTAGAAADLLDAGSKYGKVEEKSFGKHLEKAEDHLRQYEAKNSPGHGHAPSSDDHHQAGHGDGGHEKKHSEEGGVGGYMKMAQGFMK